MIAFRDKIEPFAGQPLTRQVLMSVLSDYSRPYDKINDLVKQHFLIPVKRGLFIPGPALKTLTPEIYLLANHILGPSYVSSDTALAHWGMIPEYVYEVFSMTTALSKTYNTPVGRFRYHLARLPYYSFGQMTVELTPTQRVLMAGPEKALCDKIVTTPRLLIRSVQQADDYLIEDLRMERERVRKLDFEKIAKWAATAPKKTSLSILAKAIKRI